MLWAVPDGQRICCSPTSIFRLKLYELTRYSFRREKSGELVGLRRLRAFTMPDCHAIVRDLDQAKEEFPKRFELSQSVLKEIGFSDTDYELAIRFTEDFYNQNKEFIASIIGRHGRPAFGRDVEGTVLLLRVKVGVQFHR